jgi:hypothetical protein
VRNATANAWTHPCATACGHHGRTSWASSARSRERAAQPSVPAHQVCFTLSSYKYISCSITRERTVSTTYKTDQDDFPSCYFAGLLASVFANMQAVQDIMKHTFSTEMTVTALDEPESYLRSSSSSTMMTESSKKMKYLNLYVFDDTVCSNAVFEAYIPLDTCMPNQFQATAGHFAKYVCNVTANTCVVKGFTNSACTSPASGTHRYAASIPTGCSVSAGFGTGTKYSFSSTMPYHTSGLITKMYATKTCTGPHASFYTPDGVCQHHDDEHDLVYCSMDTVYRFYNSSDCSDDYDEETSVTDWSVADYGVCESFTTPGVGDDDTVGGSVMHVCGGLTV